MPSPALRKQCPEENSFSRMSISSILRRLSIGKLTELCLNISNSWQGSKDPERSSFYLSHDFVGSGIWRHRQAPFLWKRGENLCQSLRILCRSLLWSLSTTVYSVMNIGALSKIWHPLQPQTLPGSGSGGFSGLHYSGWLALQQLWPQPNRLPRVGSAWRNDL